MADAASLPRLKLSRNLELVGLGLYISDEDTLLIADLHIGYEEALSEDGIFIPPVQTAEMRALISRMVRETGASKLVLLGDIKHEFGDVTRQEWRETNELLSFLTEELRLSVSVVRGNHDNYLIPILKKMNISLYDPHATVGSSLLIHGHKPLPVEGFAESVKLIVMGHEHPAIVLRDELGAKVKLKVFLDGEYMGKRVIVLPALSPLMPGTEVNVERKLLSPLLREARVDDFRVYAVDIEAGIYDFGLIKHLRLVSSTPSEL
ncbi:metallophosphoesterase [Infirmifilum uzonense]|uniref:metallophosphoesterase n=1 Tax=Infirmifilum uzonense TaxID=1550241 RepID=UPI000AA44533|nr:metallophosphoesterase [Infirmifilum uzonense]